jgi:hypothetical protein
MRAPDLNTMPIRNPLQKSGIHPQPTSAGAFSWSRRRRGWAYYGSDLLDEALKDIEAV